MKPMIILPPDLMAEADVQLLRDNGVCVVVAKDPALVRFVDPLPVVSSRTQVERAAIEMSRRILAGKFPSFPSRESLATMFVDLLVRGTPLSIEPTVEEREYAAREQARLDEARRLGAEEARQKREELKKKGAGRPRDNEKGQP